MCTSYTPSSITSNTKTNASSSYALGFLGATDKSDLMGWYFKHACVSNHTHKIIALHPAHPAFGLLSFRHHPRP